MFQLILFAWTLLEWEDIVGANCARVLEKGECDVYVGGIFGNEMVWPCQKTCDFCDGKLYISEI